LLRYKKRSELYETERLLQDLVFFRERHRKNPRIEEKFFAPRMNKYLFDNGIEVIVEPSISGKRPDLLSKIPNKRKYNDYLVEYKVFLKSQRNKKLYFKKAVAQTYGYAKKYQKNIIYLVLIVIGEGDIRLDLDRLNIEDDIKLPFIEFDSVKIIIVKIVLKESEVKDELGKDELIQFLSE
jgi:hypothetical protein